MELYLRERGGREGGRESSLSSACLGEDDKRPRRAFLPVSLTRLRSPVAREAEAEMDWPACSDEYEKLVFRLNTPRS